MNDDLLEIAVANNASWCDLICSTHGIETQFLPNVWLTKSLVPKYYPNLITLKPESKAEDISTIPLDHFSVKDSFGKLNLQSQGFSKLFTASWICLENNSKTQNTHSWKQISSDQELSVWEDAWGNVSSDRIFLPNLLLKPKVRIYAKMKGAGIISGFITYESDGVISVSNVFDKNNSNIWPEIVNINYKNKPLVGYEKDKDLEYAKGAGFVEIGKLTIWEK